MRTAEQITSGAKPMFDRFSEGLKVVGSGNTGGMVAMIAALNAISADHVHSVPLLKPTAIIFALAIFLFAGAYLFLMYAYTYSEHYVAILHPNESVVPDETSRALAAEAPKNASIAYMRRALILGLASTYCFFLGFVIAFVALVRY